MKEKIVLRWKKSGLQVKVTYSEMGYQIHYDYGQWGGSTACMSWGKTNKKLKRLGVCKRLPKPESVLSSATKCNQEQSSFINVPEGI